MTKESASPVHQQKSQSQTSITGFQSEEQVSKTTGKAKNGSINHRRSLQEYYKKNLEQTPKVVKSLVSIQEFNTNKNEEEEETSPMKPILDFQSTTLTKNMSAPLIKDEQPLLNLSLIPAQLQEQQMSLVFSPTASPRLTEIHFKPSNINNNNNNNLQTEHRNSSFQINLLQNSNTLNTITQQPQRLSDFLQTNNNDVSPRVIFKEKFNYSASSVKNNSMEKISFQKKIKLQEQLRKSNRKQRNQHLKNLINIQESLMSSASNLNSNFKNSIGMYYPSSTTTTTSLPNKIFSAMQLTSNELKSSFDLTNPQTLTMTQTTQQNPMNNLITAKQAMVKSMTKFCLNTPKSKAENNSNYSVPMTFQPQQSQPLYQTQTANSISTIMNKETPNVINRLFKHSSFHSFQLQQNQQQQQTMNIESSLGLTPTSNANTPSKVVKQTNQNIEEKRQMALAQIEFINKFKNNQSINTHKRAHSAVTMKVASTQSHGQQDQAQENQQIYNDTPEKPIQNDQKQLSYSHQTNGEIKRIVSPNQLRPKTAIISKSPQVKSMKKIDLSKITRASPKVQTTRPQSVISQVYMSPETMSEFQIKHKIENFKQQFAENVSCFQIDQQLSQADLNTNTFDFEKMIIHHNGQLSSNNLGSNNNFNLKSNSLLNMLTLQTARNNQNMMNQKKINSSNMKIQSSNTLAEEQIQSHQPNQIKNGGQYMDKMDLEIKSPSIINIVFPLKEKNNIKSNRGHKKQQSLTFQPQQFQQKIQSTENPQKNKESTNIFSPTKGQRPLTSLIKSNANLHYQAYRIPEVRKFLKNNNINN